jgi:SAM-dependent methyltransferase
MSDGSTGSGFDAAWLDLREPADRRSRNRGLADALGRHLGSRAFLSVVDLGCGTGANLRATAPLLGPEQHWTLVDNDERLLEAAAVRLCSWAGGAERNGSRLLLDKEGRRIVVRFARADLARDLKRALEPGADLYTASALFDLVSGDFIAALAAEVARRRAAFHAVLTYDGRQAWMPRHEADEALASAFRAHQASDKGFGPAAGPMAPALLAAAFDEAGYAVSAGDSAWHLGAGDEALIAALADGFAAAAIETRLLPDTRVADWLAAARTGAIVGHMDLLALPPRSGA